MSDVLDALLDQAADGTEITVTFSPESVAVLLYASGFLDIRKNWLDTATNPLDEITDSQWDTIEKITANLLSEVMNPVATTIIGQIAAFGLSSAPDGWLECDGSVVPQADYPELYAAIGSNFGLPTGGNFVLPDMRFRSAVGVGELDYDPAFDIGLGERVGSAELSLAIANIPTHDHQLTNNNSAPRFRHSGTAGVNASDAVLAGTTNNATQIKTTPTGSGDPFPIIPPVIGLLYCIYAGT